MDVENFDGVVCEPIEDFLGIASERRHTDVRPTGSPAYACRPPRDVINNLPDAPLDSGRDGRIVDMSQSAIATRSLRASSV
jgi:hypothetical protein